MTVIYEWVLETLSYYKDFGGGPDILDTSGYGTLAEALNAARIADERFWRIALRRDVGNDIEGLTDRLYAYPHADGKLPEYFDDTNVKVPERYRSPNVHYGDHPV